MIIDAGASGEPEPMAFGRLERTPGPQPMSDINMTPLIDVMLVLLVIFMITAPLMTSSLKLDLPKTDAGAAERRAAVHRGRARRAGPALLRRRGGRRGDASPRASPRPRAANPQTEVQLRADQSVPYGRVAELIGLVQKAGLTRIGFVTEPAPLTPAAGRRRTSEGGGAAVVVQACQPAAPRRRSVARFAS